MILDPVLNSLNELEYSPEFLYFLEVSLNSFLLQEERLSSKGFSLIHFLSMKALSYSLDSL